jgi:hypothetical protein
LIARVSPGPVDLVSLDNEFRLRELFFSGTPTAVFCHDSLPQDLSTSLTIAQKSFPDVKLAAVDCAGLLPSGKTVLERFNLMAMDGTGPGAFYTATKHGTIKYKPFPATAFPAPAKTASLVTAQRLLKIVVEANPVHYYPVKEQKDLDDKCFNRAACALVFSRGPLDEVRHTLLNRAARRFRAVSFLLVDSSMDTLKFPPSATTAATEGGEPAPSFALPSFEQHTDLAGEPVAAPGEEDLTDASWPKLVAFRSVPSKVPAELQADPKRPKRDITARALSQPFPAERGAFQPLEDFFREVYGPSNIGVVSALDAERVAEYKTFEHLGKPARSDDEPVALAAAAARRREAGLSRAGAPVQLPSPPVLVHRVAEARKKKAEKKAGKKRRAEMRDRQRAQNRRFAESEAATESVIEEVSAEDVEAAMDGEQGSGEDDEEEEEVIDLD